jgi:hypothetical protein
VYYFIGRSLSATPAQLGLLTLCRAMVQVGDWVWEGKGRDRQTDMADEAGG